MTFSSTNEFTKTIKAASATTFVALAITSLLFLFGSPSDEQVIGLGRLRVVLALSTISYGPGFLNTYREYEHDYYSPYWKKSEDDETNPDLKANERIGIILLSPFGILGIAAVFAEVVLLGVCVSRLCGPKVVRAAQFCGFETIAMTPAEAAGWTILAVVIPWALPFVPYIVAKTFKTDPVYSWRQHVRNKQAVATFGKIAFWGYTASLCGLAERFIHADPATYVPGNEELEWTFGQILPLVMTFPLVGEMAVHLGQLPKYPLPEYQPAHSRLTFYFHLLYNCNTSFKFLLMVDHGMWANLRKFMRLSKTTFLHGEHKVWIQGATSVEKSMERRRTIGKVRVEILNYIEGAARSREQKPHPKEHFGVGKSELRYMDSVVEVLTLDAPKTLRKAKSFPGSIPFSLRD
jgi:hypothetical protein